VKGSLLREELPAARPAHAYLLCCAEPARLRHAAAQLAQALNCLDGDPRRRPCGECVPCREISGGVFADFTMSTAYKLSEVRAELSRLSERPYAGRLRVLALAEGSAMTREACNALLKTLEEPAAAAVIILMVRSLDDVPATVSSRCRRISLGTTPREVVAAHLASSGIDPRRAAFAAACAGGDEELAAFWAARDTLDEFRAAAVRFVAGLLGAHPEPPLELVERHQSRMSSAEDTALWLAALGASLEAVIAQAGAGQDSLEEAFSAGEWAALTKLDPSAAAAMAQELHQAAGAVRHHAQARLSLEASLLRFRGYGARAGAFGSPHEGGYSCRQ
jgi:DNA polymerase-3 subunit gamma/tau